ncbi:NAD(P)-binding domain-containing protein [Streptomyces sp. NPDC047043]|uniref:flavin-containing monooxygenase n=1 Tax=Streptomyces sp. NPDC047043 TaxID=3154497 RepID=UPI003401D2AE
MTSPRYCIIGAGAAGLAALQVLTDRGFAVDCFERTDRVGGHWHTDYDSLHLITSRDVSGFDGFPMPADYPVYPSRDQMRAYLESFAEHHGLHERITFGTEVERVRPADPTLPACAVGGDGWIVETSDGETRTYDAVLVANGHLTDPYIPHYDGEFTGKQLHSSDYGNTEDIEGHRVLVVGAGNSGCDLVVDAAHARLDANISVRHGQVFQPKALFGKPRAELHWLTRLPGFAQERLTRTLVNIAVGPPTAYRGLPEPATRNLNKQRPVVNNLLLYWIQHGRITVRPGIERFDGRTVHFTDGSAKEFDTVVWATGFRTSLPFLDPDLLTWRDRTPLRVAGLTVPVGLEGLYFIGLAAPRGPQLPVYCAQAKLVARFLELQQRGDVALSGFFGDRQTADARIDIVRKVWLKQMDATHKALAPLARTIAGGAP